MSAEVETVQNNEQKTEVQANNVNQPAQQNHQDPNDADNKLVASIPRTLEEIRKNFQAQTPATKTFAWRNSQLKQLRNMLVENKDKWELAIEKDLGKSLLIKGIESSGSIAEIDHILTHLQEWMKPKSKPVSLIMHKLGSAQILYEPYGVVCIIAPWNFPISLLVKPLAGAIAAGNCAVLRPSEVSAHVQRLWMELVPKYLDNKAICVFGGGISVSKALLDHQYDYMFYTGGTSVGKIVMEKCAKFLTPMTLELGGKSPCYVDKDIDLELAAKRIAWGKFLNCGQVCVAPDYLLLHKEIADSFIEKFKEVIKQFFGNDPQKSGDYNRIVSLRHWQRLTNLIKENEKNVVFGGQSVQEDLYISPTLIKQPDPKSNIMQEEIFGPLLLIFTVESVDEAITFINFRPKPLALYIFSTNTLVQQRIMYHTSSGGVAINDCVSHVSVPSLPFGGVGPSGMGSYNGKKTFTTFCHKKSVFSNSTMIDPSARYPPLDERKVKQMTAAYSPLSFSSVFNFLSS